MASQLSVHLSNTVWTNRFLIIGLASGVMALLFLGSKFVLGEPDNVGMEEAATGEEAASYSMKQLWKMVKNYKYLLI